MHPPFLSNQNVAEEQFRPLFVHLNLHLIFFYPHNPSNHLSSTGVGVHLLNPVSILLRLLAGCGDGDRGSAHLSLSAGQGDVDETAGVLQALESTALGDLGLLLGLNLFVETLSVTASSSEGGRRFIVASSHRGIASEVAGGIVPWESET